MKKVLFFLLLLISIHVAAQDGPYYIAAKYGLSMRERPNASSALIIKIPYGEK